MAFPYRLISAFGVLARVRRRYTEIHASLLTKGLSFSLIVATVPLLFMLLAVGSFFVTPQLVELVESEFLGFLPEGVRNGLINGVKQYSRNPGSLSLITVGIFFLAVHNLFLDLHRTVSIAIRGSGPSGHAGSRLVALAGNALFLVFLYVATLVSTAARWAVHLTDIHPGLISAGARALSVVLIALVFYAVFRAGAQSRLRFIPAALISLLASVIWQAVLSGGSAIVQAAGTRFLAYGVLAWAIVFLVFMRVMAEILVYAALFVREKALPEE
ncbi:MAG: YhjD/YihY/BrkB family envelope integrity protein [Spirochaetia bacterium]